MGSGCDLQVQRRTTIHWRTLILMGPQGSGKGTQSERVRTTSRIGLIATGETLSGGNQRWHGSGSENQAIYDRGRIGAGRSDQWRSGRCSDSTNWRGAFQGAVVDGALYDGFPRTTLPKPTSLNRLLASRGEAVTAVIAIDVPRETSDRAARPGDESAPAAAGSTTSLTIRRSAHGRLRRLRWRS